jgi:hypothetical protein
VTPGPVPRKLVERPLAEQFAVAPPGGVEAGAGRVELLTQDRERVLSELVGLDIKRPGDQLEDRDARAAATGLTRRQLAREASINIETIEHGEEHGMPVYNSLTLALGRGLGIDLTNPDPYDTPPDDIEILGGILAELRQPVRTHAIAEALAWTPARVQASAAQLRTELQQLGQTVTQTADGRLSIAAYQVNLTDEQRERIRSRVLRIDLLTAQVIHAVITGRRAERYWDDLDKEQHDAATELIAAGVIVSCHDELTPSERLEAAIDNFPLQQLRW